MKYTSLFSGENKKNNISLSSAELAQRIKVKCDMVRVQFYQVTTHQQLLISILLVKAYCCVLY